MNLCSTFDCKDHECSAGEAECCNPAPDCPCDPPNVLIDARVFAGYYPSEVSWGIDDSAATCKGRLCSPPYYDSTTFTTSLCLAAGAHTLYMHDSYGDGWNKGTIEIVGVTEELDCTEVPAFVFFRNLSISGPAAKQEIWVCLHPQYYREGP